MSDTETSVRPSASEVIELNKMLCKNLQRSHMRKRVRVTLRVISGRAHAKCWNQSGNLSLNGNHKKRGK
ncbi:MAG: hypothetical protein AOA66_0802 [Candidatus Bathyarchaeota archaeon BA2]|nr:MAG: hypothetical protein AOA66_0802 [Candidatus Bathyarchaeota archaeon BA2]